MVEVKLGKLYSLEDFRKNPMPDREHSLLFRLNNKTVDCDIGDVEVSKFRPVKIMVGLNNGNPLWAESDGNKLQLFCAHTLKRWLNTRERWLDTDLFYYGSPHSTNPFDNREIKGVQYLDQKEIGEEVKKYSEEKGKVQILNARLEQLKHEKLNIDEQIKTLAANGESTQVKKALLDIKEQQIKAVENMLGTMSGAGELTEEQQTLLRYDHSVDDTGVLLTPLIAAIRKNDEDAVEILLDDGANPDEVDKNGDNALHIAVKNGCRLPLFQSILENIQNVNAGDNHGSTALMQAAAWNHLDMVTALMNHPEIDVNVRNSWNTTALHLAVEKNRPAIVAQLVSDDRVDTSLKAYNNTPLGWAMYLGHHECAKILRDRISLKYKNIVGQNGKLLTPLIAAIKKNDEDAVDVFLQKGADPNEVDVDGSNALHLAADKEDCSLSLFHRILGMIHNVNAGDNLGTTALMKAARFNHLDMVVSLMNHPGIDVNVQDSYNRTALHMAVSNNHLAIVEQLFCDNRVDTSLKDNIYGTPLQLAIVYERHECAKILRDPNEVDKDGNNALHRVARKGCRIPLFNRYLGMIHNVNAVNKYGTTALMTAVRQNRLDMVISLMNHTEIDLNVQDRSGFTALHWAVFINLPTIVEQLFCDNRVDTSRKDDNNRTPLKLATNSQRPECEKILRDPNQVDKDGRNALHMAAWKGYRLPLFNRYLGMIHNVNAVDKYGTTALMYAARENHLDMVVSLMNHPGIDLNVQGFSNWTALHEAVFSNRPAIVAQLVSDDRVDTSLKSKFNSTPLKLAIEYGFDECVKILREHAQKERGMEGREKGDGSGSGEKGGGSGSGKGNKSDPKKRKKSVLPEVDEKGGGSGSGKGNKSDPKKQKRSVLPEVDELPFCKLKM